MTAPSDSIVQVRDVWMTFPGKRRSEQVHVLESINIDVSAGEFVCIVGPSGCGKSTLLNVIGGFLLQTRGKVVVEGQPVTGPDRRRIFVFQENGVFPWLTVEQNIGFGLSQLKSTERNRVIAHYVEMVGLSGFKRSYPRELSGGMRQRVEIARALAADPDIIYMDEPFGALDFLTRLKMRADLIRIWQREKKTILFVTHDIEEAVQLADRVLVMSKRPATIRDVVKVELPRPRDIDSPEYLKTRDRIFQSMGMDVHTGVVKESMPAPAVASAPVDSLDTDVVVIGGGPAGSILAAYLAKAGVRHLIVEKAVHPRPHVGESLVCSTTRVFDEIGVLPLIERQGFVRKYGASWSHWSGKGTQEVRFRDIPRLGIRQEWTYHVDRSRFDSLLLQHAISRGSKLLEGAGVQAVEFDAGGFATGVRIRSDGSERLLKCRMVVDASGRGTVLGSQLGLRENDPEFHQFAVHNWFEGVDRGDPATADFARNFILPNAKSWAWQIPISAKITSVGVVVSKDDFMKSGEEIDAFFRRACASHPELNRSMERSRALEPFSREGNFSYRMKQLAGNGWLLVGDAARFIDPIFSSGVSLAAESARRAAMAVISALAANDVSAARFTEYEKSLGDAAEHWRELIRLFYLQPQMLMQNLAVPGPREEILELLQGEFYDRGELPILNRLRQSTVA